MIGEFSDENEARCDGVINSIEGFIKISEAAYKRLSLANATIRPWFRGQSKFEWGLKPSIYRGVSSQEDSMEREMLRDFKIKAKYIIDKVPDSEIDWLFLGQHFGLPTRLLDWSENPLVSLYFACCSHSDADGAVWMLNPWRLNLSGIALQSIPTSESPLLSDYVIDLNDPAVPRTVRAQRPVAIRSNFHFMRSISQSAFMTIHGCSVKSINVMREHKNKTYLIKYRVPMDAKSGLLRSLDRLGVDEFFLYRSLESLSSQLVRRYRKA